MMAVSNAVSPPGTVCKKDDSHLDLARLDDDEKEVNAGRHSLPRMYSSDVYSQLIGEKLEAAIRDCTPLAFTDFTAKVVRALDNLEAENNRSEMQVVNEQKVVAVLHTLSNCLDRLDQKLLVPIVNEFLKFKRWSEISPIITEAYVQFLCVVLSSAPKWWPEIATKVLQQFVRSPTKLRAHHIVLRRLLAIVPTSSAGLSEIFQANFPHQSSSSSELVNYVENLLRTLEYAPEQTASVWHLIVQKLVTLDVECESAEEAIKRRLDTLDSDSELDSDLEEDSSGSDSSSGSDMDSDMDSDSEITDSEGDIDSDIGSDTSDTDVELVTNKSASDLVNKRTHADEIDDGVSDDYALSAKRQKIENFDEGDEITNVELAMAAAAGQMEPISAKVDAVLSKLLGHLSSKFTPQMVKSGQSTPLFKTLLLVFREVVLPTANLQATQFLWFYITHAHADLLAAFISGLLESALSLSTSYEQRVRAMQYVASFVARAKGLTKQQIVFVVEFLANWVQRYIREREHEVDSSLSMARFRMFYATVQALFYIFVFRHSMLRNDGTRGWVANVDKLFPQVINSKFNPLQYCQPQVVAMFAAVAQHEEVASCYSIIERNRWGSFRANSQLGSAHRTGAHNGLFDNNRDSKLYDSFFPFQPLRLKQSRQYFTTIFEKWSEVDLSDSDTDREMELDRGIDASESDY